MLIVLLYVQNLEKVEITKIKLSWEWSCRSQVFRKGVPSEYPACSAQGRQAAPFAAAHLCSHIRVVAATSAVQFSPCQDREGLPALLLQNPNPLPWASGYLLLEKDVCSHGGSLGSQHSLWQWWVWQYRTLKMWNPFLLLLRGALEQMMRNSHSRQWEALEGDDGSAPIGSWAPELCCSPFT